MPAAPPSDDEQMTAVLGDDIRGDEDTFEVVLKRGRFFYKLFLVLTPDGSLHIESQELPEELGLPDVWTFAVDSSRPHMLPEIFYANEIGIHMTRDASGLVTFVAIFFVPVFDMED